MHDNEQQICQLSQKIGTAGEGWWVVLLLRSQQDSDILLQAQSKTSRWAVLLLAFLYDWKKFEEQCSHKVQFMAGKVRTLWLSL